MPRRKQSKRLVVDASVARSAGGEGATYPVSKYCRDCLIAIREVCHRVVVTPEITEEWKRNQSRFARQWRVSMEARKKVIRVETTPDKGLREEVGRITIRDKDLQALLKDILLIEAAMVADQTILSLDDTVRALFIEVAGRVRHLKGIVWVNPALIEEGCLSWLEDGAKVEKHRQIGFKGKRL